MLGLFTPDCQKPSPIRTGPAESGLIWRKHGDRGLYGEMPGSCGVSGILVQFRTSDEEEDAVPAPAEFRPGQSKLSLKCDPEHSDGLQCLASCNNVPGVGSQTFILGRKLGILGSIPHNRDGYWVNSLSLGIPDTSRVILSILSSSTVYPDGCSFLALPSPPPSSPDPLINTPVEQKYPWPQPKSC